MSGLHACANVVGNMLRYVELSGSFVWDMLLHKLCLHGFVTSAVKLC